MVRLGVREEAGISGTARRTLQKGVGDVNNFSVLAIRAFIVLLQLTGLTVTNGLIWLNHVLIPREIYQPLYRLN
jgi:hypothetical protein